jgi:hypothetical protein
MVHDMNMAFMEEVAQDKVQRKQVAQYSDAMSGLKSALSGLRKAEAHPAAEAEDAMDFFAAPPAPQAAPAPAAAPAAPGFFSMFSFGGAPAAAGAPPPPAAASRAEMKSAPKPRAKELSVSSPHFNFTVSHFLS